MKYALVLVITLFSGMALAGEGWHKFSSGDNPHAKGGCASKNGKIAQMQKFHGKGVQQADAEKKTEAVESKKEPKLEDFI